MPWSSFGLTEVEVVSLVVEAVDVDVDVVDGVTGAGFAAGVLSVKVTMKSSSPDVELGLETLGHGVVPEGSLVIDSTKVAVVKGKVVVMPCAVLVLEGMSINVVDSARYDGSGHLYVGQHSLFDGAMISQSADSGGGHSLIAQVTSVSKH